MQFNKTLAAAGQAHAAVYKKTPTEWNAEVAKASREYNAARAQWSREGAIVGSEADRNQRVLRDVRDAIRFARDAAWAKARNNA